jgi:hypothetical protein
VSKSCCSTCIQSPYCEANIHSGGLENTPPFMDPEVSLPCLQEPVTGLCPQPDSFSPHLSALLP